MDPIPQSCVLAYFFCAAAFSSNSHSSVPSYIKKYFAVSSKMLLLGYSKTVRLLPTHRYSVLLSLILRGGLRGPPLLARPPSECDSEKYLAGASLRRFVEATARWILRIPGHLRAAYVYFHDPTITLQFAIIILVFLLLPVALAFASSYTYAGAYLYVAGRYHFAVSYNI
jgi:hypothetical protein